MRLLLRLIGIFLLVLPPTVLADFNLAVSTEAGSGISIGVSSPYNYAPPWGAVPLYLEITNLTRAPGSWQLKSSNWGNGNREELQFVRTFRVPAGGKIKFELYLPLGVLRDAQMKSYNSPVNWQIEGPGVESFATYQFPRNSRDYNHSLTPFVALSPRYQNEISRAESLFKEKQLVFSGTSFSLANLPTHSEAYLGTEILHLALDEWNQLAPLQRQALREWVISGGKLYLSEVNIPELQSHTISNLGVFTAGNNELRLGAGRVIIEDIKIWNDFAETLANQASWDTQHLLSQIKDTSYPNDWPLAKDISPIVLRAGLVILIILFYSAFIGPLNLLQLAPRTHRYRIYVTTPLIAAATTALLFLIILFQDGTGAEGARLAMVILDPSSNNALILQEQVTKSGMLLTRRFSPAEHTVIHPLLFTKLDNGSTLTPAQSVLGPASKYFVDNDVYSGDWFKSRAIQAHVLSRFVSTRGKFDVDMDSSSPTIQSSINVSIDELYVGDGHGRWWNATKVNPGKKVPLGLAKKVPMDAWISNQHNLAGNRIQETLRRLPKDQPFVLAMSSEPNEYFIETLRGVRWNKNISIYFATLDEAVFRRHS